MARTPARLAVKIDRASRVAHRFHRFAHHPLCDEYGGEVVRLGRRTRVCRGCALTAVGGASGLLASLVVTAPPPLTIAIFATGMLGLVATTFKRAPRGDESAARGDVGATLARASGAAARTPKLVSRFLPALVMSFALGRAAASGPFGWMLGAAAIAALAVVSSRYRRRGPDRSPCASCAERNAPRPCRGIAPIVRRERAFRRLAGQWLTRVGP